MNKITKIWALCLALCALVVSLKASAGTTWDQKTVSLTLTDSDNSCVVDNYNLGSHTVAWIDQNVTEATRVIDCTFLKSTKYLMNISLANLSDWWSNSIASTNFTWVFGTFTKNWSLEDFTTTTIEFDTTGQTIYTKDINKIGSLSWNLTIWWVIPAWTPAWTYTGELNLTLQSQGS